MFFFRFEKVSSNDVDLLEDPSAEEYVGATCGLKDDGKPTTSASKNSITEQREIMNKGTFFKIFKCMLIHLQSPVRLADFVIKRFKHALFGSPAYFNKYH
jgi:hypothetical protein